MRNYIQRGETLTVPAPYAVASGGGCKVSAGFGVAAYAADPGVNVELDLVGTFELPRTGAALAYFDPVYWDDAGKAVTSVATGNMRIGIAAVPAAADSPTAQVRLNGSF